MWVKICGVTNAADAAAVVSCGADALGINLVPSSRRFVRDEDAVALMTAIRALPDACELVAVVADPTPERVAQLLALGFDRVQLHGAEPDELVRAAGPRAFKAVGIRCVDDVERARRTPGSPLLVDAKVAGELGGTGQRFDWSLVRELARERELVLAGGLTPDNVAEAVERVAPFGVDVASGVEVPDQPRRKDLERVRRFVSRARAT